MTRLNNQFPVEGISLLNSVMYGPAQFSLNSICAIKSMISLEMKCPQLSRPEATTARNQNSIQDVHLSFFSHKESIFEENIPGFFLHIVYFSGDQ